MTQLLIGCMEILFLKLACYYFQEGLGAMNVRALPKNTVPIHVKEQ
jgi:hypothetical protein